MRLIEFAIQSNKKLFSPTVILLDCEEIAGFEQLKNNHNFCKILTKNHKEYIAYGQYKTLTNRFFYTLSKKHNWYEDDIIRPSIRVFHRPQSLEADVAFFDILQLNAFICALDESLIPNKIPEYTNELIKKIGEIDFANLDF